MEQPNGQQIPSITPTIFIGLGGTGKDIILRLRKLMATQFGGVSDRHRPAGPPGARQAGLLRQGESLAAAGALWV